jgi:hypothetical protein
MNSENEIRRSLFYVVVLVLFAFVEVIVFQPI